MSDDARVTVWWEAVDAARIKDRVVQVTTVEKVSGTMRVQGRLFWTIETDDGELVSVPRQAVRRTERHDIND